jgi:hypothetical protein
MKAAQLPEICTGNKPTTLAMEPIGLILGTLGVTGLFSVALDALGRRLITTFRD